jgi:hypothetical protein
MTVAAFFFFLSALHMAAKTALHNAAFWSLIPAP